MANTTKALTNTEVKQAKPASKEYHLGDGKGLRLRVRPNGTKQWLFNYFKPYTKKRTNISLGQYPATSLSKARRDTLENRELLADNVDPKEYRLEQDRKSKEAQLNTFGFATTRWLLMKRKHGGDEISPSYRKRIVEALELHVLPTLEEMPLHKVTAPFVIENILDPLGKKGALETIRKLCRWINEIMVLSVNAGLIQSNPLTGIRSNYAAPKITHHPHVEAEELPKFMQDLEAASITLETKCLIKWQLHTMVRPGEAAAARWIDINLAAKEWEIPKDGMKMKRSHVVPLTRQTVEILELVRPFSGHFDYVFPSRIKPKQHTNKETANVALKRMGYKGKQTAHGFRALSSTILNEKRFDADIIEISLAHIDSSIRGTYNHAKYLPSRREMLEWWSAYLEQAATGERIPTGATRHLKAV